MPQHEKKLEEIYQLVRQNNKLLRSMKRRAFWGTIFKLVLYAIMLGIPVFLYFTIFQPIISDLLGTVQQFQAAGQQIQSSGASAVLQLQGLGDLINNIPGVDFSGTSQ